MQEFNSSSDFTASSIVEHTKMNQQILLDNEVYKKRIRRKFPFKNYIEQVNMKDYLNSYGKLPKQLDD